MAEAFPALTAFPLEGLQYVKGSPIDLIGAKGHNVVVIEFWATWCPPCRQSIGHLSELQAKYKDKGLIILGVSRENKEKVAEFVASMGDKMNYTVAVDPDGYCTIGTDSTQLASAFSCLSVLCCAITAMLRMRWRVAHVLWCAVLCSTVCALCFMQSRLRSVHVSDWCTWYPHSSGDRCVWQARVPRPSAVAHLRGRHRCRSQGPQTLHD